MWSSSRRAGQSVLNTSLAGELRDEHDRLDALRAGEPALDVRAVFARSYHALEPDAARLFRLLGLTALTRLGDAHHASQDQPVARDAWRHTLDILDELEHPDAKAVRAKLAGMAEKS